MYGDFTRPDGNHEQNPRVVATILIANVDNARMQRDDPQYGGLLRLRLLHLSALVSHSVTKCGSTYVVILGWSSLRG